MLQISRSVLIQKMDLKFQMFENEKKKLFAYISNDTNQPISLKHQDVTEPTFAYYIK